MTALGCGQFTKGHINQESQHPLSQQLFNQRWVFFSPLGPLCAGILSWWSLSWTCVHRLISEFMIGTCPIVSGSFSCKYIHTFIACLHIVFISWIIKRRMLNFQYGSVSVSPSSFWNYHLMLCYLDGSIYKIVFWMDWPRYLIKHHYPR